MGVFFLIFLVVLGFVLLGGFVFNYLFVILDGLNFL